MLETRREGSFLIRILDQQHNSWQGTITWLADNDKRTFRSLLELINLISAELARGEGGGDDDMDGAECGEGLFPMMRNVRMPGA